MERYEKYKDSGVEWIGEVPAHWEVKALKRLAKICNGQDHKNVWAESGDYPIIGSGGEFGKANSYLHEGPSVILGRKGTIDKPQYIEQPFWSVDTAYFTNIKNNVHSKLFYYLCTTINFDLYKYGSAVPSMTQEVLSQIQFAISSSFAEQTAIASYLDRKTAEIDQLIADKKRLITLYEEEKTALINQAVTKGINPEVKMKDSGIEWLGEVPEHWEVTKMKHSCAFILDGTHGSFSRVSEGYRLLSVRNIINNEFIFRDDDSKVSESDFYEISKRFLVQKDDVQLAIVGATLGKVAIVKDLPENFVTQRSVATLRTNMKCLPQYLFYFIRNSYFQSFLWLNAGFSAQPGVYLGTIQNASIPLPDLSTQIKIIEWISFEEKRVDAKIAKTQKLIDLLTEYRTALISEVVTGKIKIA